MGRRKTLADVVALLAPEPFTGEFGSFEVPWKTVEGEEACHQDWPPHSCPENERVRRHGTTAQGRIDDLASRTLCPACFEAKGLKSFLSRWHVQCLLELQRGRNALVDHLAASDEGSYTLYKRVAKATKDVRRQWGGLASSRYPSSFVADFVATAEGPLAALRQRAHQLRDELTAAFARNALANLEDLDTTPTLVGFPTAWLGYGKKKPLCVKALEVYRLDRSGDGLLLLAPRFVVDRLLAKLPGHRPIHFTTSPAVGADGAPLGDDVLEVAAALWDPQGAVNTAKLALAMGKATLKTPGWAAAAA